MQSQTSVMRSATRLLCASALALILLAIGDVTVDAAIAHDTGLRSHQPTEMLYAAPMPRSPLHPYRTLLERLMNRACEQGILPTSLCATVSGDRDVQTCPERTPLAPHKNRPRAFA